MKERILTGWNFQRILFLVLGGIILFTAIPSLDWISIALGGYFFSMGLFAFGCAAGNCYNKISETNPDENKPELKDIIYEEIKSK